MLECGNRLKELRESLGYGPDEFAKALGVHRSSIYRYEGSNKAEKRDMPISFAILISERFNISLDWLVGTSDIKYKTQSTSKLTELYESLSDAGRSEVFNYAMYIKRREEGKE